MHKHLSAIFCFIVTSFGSVVMAQSMTLSQSVEKAVLSNPHVGAMFQDFQSSLEGQSVKRGELLPEVNAQGWVGREWRHNPSHNWSRRGYGLDLRQFIFDGSSTGNRVVQGEREKLGSHFRLLEPDDR